MSSYSNSSAGGSVKFVNETKSVSPVKKGVSMHTEIVEKKSETVKEWKGAESLRSMKI